MFGRERARHAHQASRIRVPLVRQQLPCLSVPLQTQSRGNPTSEVHQSGVNAAIENRIRYFEQKADSLYSLQVYYVILFEGFRHKQAFLNSIADFPRNPRKALDEMRAALSSRKQVALLDGELSKALATLHQKVRSFILQVTDFVRVDLLVKQEAFGVLKRTLNFDPLKLRLARLKHDSFLDYFLSESHLECHRGHLRLDDYYLKVLTLKEPTAQSFPLIFKSLLEVQANFHIVTEWKKEDSTAPAATPIQDKAPKPPGLMPKNIQAWVMLGLAVLMVLIMWLTGGKKKPQSTPKSSVSTFQPAAQPEINEAQIAALQNRIQELQREQQTALKQQSKFFGSLPSAPQNDLRSRAGVRSGSRTGVARSSSGREEEESIRIALFFQRGPELSQGAYAGGTNNANRSAFRPSHRSDSAA